MKRKMRLTQFAAEEVAQLTSAKRSRAQPALAAAREPVVARCGTCAWRPRTWRASSSSGGVDARHVRGRREREGAQAAARRGHARRAEPEKAETVKPKCVLRAEGR